MLLDRLLLLLRPRLRLWHSPLLLLLRRCVRYLWLWLRLAALHRRALLRLLRLGTHRRFTALWRRGMRDLRLNALLLLLAALHRCLALLLL